MSENTKRKAEKIFQYVMAACIAAGYLFFWFNKNTLMLPAADEEVVKVNEVGRIFWVTLLAVIGIAVVFLPRKLSEKHEKIVSGICFVLTPAVSFFLLEYANIVRSIGPLALLSVLGKRRLVLTAVILTLLLLAVYCICNNTKISATIISVAICIFGTANYFTYLFRGLPLLASDVSAVGTAFNVMSDYQYTLNYATYILMFGTLIWCICISRTQNLALPVKIRIPVIIGYVLVTVISVRVMLYSDFLKQQNVKLNMYKPQKSYNANGSVLTFVRSIQYVMVEKPEGYSDAEVQKLARQYPSDEAGTGVQPNVIMIMDEAFSNMQELADFKTNQPVLPFFSSLKENTIRGQMYVSIFGGQTANTEYEVLTGNSKVFMPPSANPYQLFVKHDSPSLAWHLKKQGYQGMVAMHPFLANGYSRDRVYPRLGFDTFLTVDDFKDPKLVREFVSDETDFNRIISEYEAAKKKSTAPFFLFNVTMQNHSSYTQDYDNLPKDIVIEDSQYYGDQLERYLNLTHLTDKDLKNLLEYFEQQEEPTVIVFFGDHRPSLHDGTYNKLYGKTSGQLTNLEVMEKYKVPFIIWANYDIEEKDMGKISSNYLSSIMASNLGMNMTGYNKFLTEVQKQVPALTVNGYFGADGKLYQWGDKNSPYYDILHKYSILQYNNIFGKDERVADFFE